MPEKNSDCNDHWCENYGKGGGECDHCEKQTRNRDAPELRVILRRRKERHMENEKTPRVSERGIGGGQL